MLNACTIIACNYLPFATVLANSFFEHHPDGKFSVLLVDDEQRAFAPADTRVSWLRLADIGFDLAEIRRLAGIYDVTELATAVKPMLLQHLLDAGASTILYLDPDIRVYESLQPIADLAAEHGIVLTPHTMQPYPSDERQIDSFFVLAAGVYNLGFVAVGPKGRPFLEWWWRQTKREALIDVTKMMFTDQRWVDFVPSLFEHYILKDPGYNVAYWNLHGREVTRVGDRYLINGLPLRFFHFSGFDARKPWLLSKHQGERPRVLLSDRPALARLCREFLIELEAAGIRDTNRPPYGWDTLPSGLKLSTRMRRLYWGAVVGAEQGRGSEPPSPFDEARPNAFVDWLGSPAEQGPARVSRYLYSIYRDRVDLQGHFPDIFGNDAPRFLDWIWNDGVQQERIPAELMPPRETHAGVAGSSAPAQVQEGVNVSGYFRAELGIGEAARQLTAAIDTANIPFSTTTYDVTFSRQTHPFADREAKGVAYDINVLCVNADSTPRFARDMGPGFFAGRHTAGYWFWEIEQFPEVMKAAFDVVDEVWTATDFVAEAIRSVNAKPVFTIPLPVPTPQYSSSITRERLGLSDRFTFLFVFDFLSIVERKNPHGLIEAFTRAFTPDEGPVLVLKSINGNLRLSELERLRAAIGGRQDISVVEGYVTAEEKNAMLGLCDCYVSLHRSEGLGLTMAEAMALGRPVIATGYSGNVHFMTKENSYLVDYTKVPVPKGCDPYPTTASWAEPNLDQAAAFMREVYERPEQAKQRAERGRQDIIERHSREACARVVAARVDAIHHERRTRIVALPGAAATATTSAPAGAPPPPVTVEQLEGELAPLIATATLRLSAEGRRFQGLRLMVQRAFFRALRPLWFQQHQFHEHIVAAFRLTVGVLRADQRARETTETRVRELTRKLLSTRRETQRLQHETDLARAGANRLETRTGAIEQQLGQIDHTLAAAAQSVQQLDLVTGLVGTLGADVALVKDAVVGASTRTQELASTVEQQARGAEEFRTNATAHLQGLTTSAQASESRLTTLSNRLYATPYMSDPSRFLERDTAGRPRLGYRREPGRSPSAFYRGFQDVFRGPETLIRERQRPYVPLLQGRTQVVDLGCGRGEMLDLLKEAGVTARGVDTDHDMVRYGRSKGHNVIQMDALAFLRTQPAASIDAIFCAQMIEHLRYPELKELLELCRSRLTLSGLFIAETVNPHALEAFKTFYTDLTHERPIFPEVALSLFQLAGFDEAYVMFPTGTGELAHDREQQGEYAVVATVRTNNDAATSRDA